MQSEARSHLTSLPKLQMRACDTTLYRSSFHPPHRRFRVGRIKQSRVADVLGDGNVQHSILISPNRIKGCEVTHITKKISKCKSYFAIRYEENYLYKKATLCAISGVIINQCRGSPRRGRSLSVDG